MDELPPPKSAPKPSSAEIEKAKEFELDMVEAALKHYRDQSYVQAALLSWSFIEEFFLPTLIRQIAKDQKLSFKKALIDGSSVNHLIKYYYFISYDEEMFKLLEEARILRNDLVHKMYKSGSLTAINDKAKKSAHYNLHTLTSPALARLTGKEVAPSLNLYIKGWNDMRAKFLSDIDARRKELEGELEELNRKLD